MAKIHLVPIFIRILGTIEIKRNIGTKWVIFFSKCDQTHRQPRIWSHLLKKSLVKNFIFWAVGQIVVKLSRAE